MADVTAGTGVTVTHTPGEASNATIAIGQAVETNSNVTFNDLTVNGNVVANAAVTINGVLTVQEIAETTEDGTISANVLTVDYTSTNIVYVSSPSANFTVNLTNAPTTNNRMMTISVVVDQGATGYIPSVFQIAGSAQTIKWSGGSAPGATNSKIDIFSFSLLRRSNAWTVFGAVSANY
jgi:hypothetical protein